MSTAEALPAVAFEDFLAYEQSSPRPHEWVAGHVFGMAGGTERHDNLVALVYEHLAPRARRQGCLPFAHNRLVRLGSAAYRPDVLIVCPGGGPEPHQLYERDLSTVVEVLSSSTEGTDRREKAMVYATAPSFQRYLLLDPLRRQIEVGTLTERGMVWTTYLSGELVPDVELNVDTLYDQLDQATRT